MAANSIAAVATRDMDAQKPMTVYDCIAAVSADLAQEGVAKTRKNAQQGYQFRGIDEVMNALAPLLAKHRLVILPRILARSVTEREAKSGGTLFTVTVEAEFDFVSAADGSKHTVKTFGEAMDSADKATNKAMSAAYKYAAFQAFCIPTEGDNDADAQTPEPVVRVSTPAAVTREAMITTGPLPATIAASSNGTTAAFEAVDAGSTPAAAATAPRSVPAKGTLPDGAKRIARIGEGRAGAHGEVFFEGESKGVMVWKASVIADAERFLATATPVFAVFKKSVSGNERIEALNEARPFR